MSRPAVFKNKYSKHVKKSSVLLKIKILWIYYFEAFCQMRKVLPYSFEGLEGTVALANLSRFVHIP